MENSNLLFFPVKRSERNDFDLMHSMLRYIYCAKRNTLMLNKQEAEEREALQHNYYSRAALKRRLKQVAMIEHELQN